MSRKSLHLHAGSKPVTQELGPLIRQRLSDALNERATRVASEGGPGWERAVEALREAAEDVANRRL